MVFGSNDGERMTVFGVEGMDVSAVLEAAASQTWEMMDDQPPAWVLRRQTRDRQPAVSLLPAEHLGPRRLLPHPGEAGVLASDTAR